jgi:REP-associated tyrosine transposase
MADTFTKLLFHIVFSTKRRQPFISDTLRKELYPYMEGILRRREGVLLNIGGTADHVHLLLRLKPDMSVSKIVQAIKAISSKWVHERPDLPQEFAWQSGYGAFSVSESQARTVWRYIEHQEEHHRKVSFEDELRGLLEKHGIEFDPAYLLD